MFYQLLYLCHHMHIDVRTYMSAQTHILRHHGDAYSTLSDDCKIIVLWI